MTALCSYGWVFFFYVLSAATMCFAADNITHVQDSLPCADVDVIAQTYCISSIDFETQCIKQQIRIVDKRLGKSKNIAIAGHLVKKPSIKLRRVLDAFVTDWACLKSTKGINYVLLFYTCSPGDERGYCAQGYKQWDSLFNLDGVELTGHARHKDARRKRLERKLGLREMFANGIGLQGLDYLGVKK